jgi:dTDP-4-dehydrorhamnose reductase
MVFISTDYVFDGTAGPYGEDDTTNPINYYGQTKLDGEVIINQMGIEHLIIRTTVIFGHHALDKLNFVTWVIDKLRKKEKINAVFDQFGNPTLADSCAEIILQLLMKERCGIYNVVGKDYVNRFAFASEIADVFGLDKTLINPVSSEYLNQTAKRPKFGGFKTNKIEEESGIKLLTTEESLGIMKTQMADKFQ